MTEDEKQHIRQSILDLIAASALSYPNSHLHGWHVVAENTGFMEKAIELTGNAAGNFVDAIATVDLTYYDAVEEFRRAKHTVMMPTHKKGSKNNAQPVAVKPSTPQPGSVVLPEPVRGPVAPEARPDANRTGDPAAVVQPVGQSGGDPGVRRSVHRDKKAEPVTLPDKQPSLF